MEPEIKNSSPATHAPDSESQYAKSRLYFFRTLKILAFLFAVLGAYTLGYGRGHSAFGDLEMPPVSPEEAVIVGKTDPAHRVDFSLFWKVWDLVKEKYVDSETLDAHQMLYGAIDGLLSATDDPYTTFFDPEENKQFDEKISGNFEGIGAEIGLKDNALTIIAPLDDSPAEQAGLRANDKVFKIDGQDTTLYTLDEAVQKIRGPKGTTVTLTIFRTGEEETRDIQVIRDTIQVKSIKVEWKEEGTIAVIRVSQFGKNTDVEFNQAVQEVAAAKAQALILDLRNNPGGFLEGAVDLAGAFLPKQTPVVIEEDAEGRQTTLKSAGSNRLGHLPTVVLINEGSASASEILAGALKENRPENVTLIGKTSYGKGSVQELINVTNNTALKVTVAKWLTPSGKQINEHGITPDITVDLTNADFEAKRDPQLDKALEFLKEKIRPTVSS